MAALLHQRLSDAAEAGDIDDLYAVLEQDSGILEVIDQNPFTTTPLHVAVIAGQACFVEEITNLKLSFARKLNPSGYSPLHLAATNGHVEIVKQLLTVDSSLVQLQGREKRTPLHCASMAGSVEVLDELIFNCTKSLQMLTVRKETALHLAVKHGQLETVKALLNWIRELGMESLLSWADQEGNTILHLATSFRRYQMVEMLCSAYKFRRAVKVNARNNNGLTALDMDESVRHPGEPIEVQNISNILHKAGSRQAGDLKIKKPPSTPTKQPRLAVHRRQRILHYFTFSVPDDTSLDIRNVLLVILVLISTVTFQVGITPPGGMWQEDSKVDSSNDKHLAGYPTRETQATTNLENPNALGPYVEADPANGKHFTGYPIWESQNPIGYYIFQAVNFAGFFMSSMLIIRLVEGYPYVWPIRLAQSLLVFTYVWSAPFFPTTYTSYVIITVVLLVGTMTLLWIHQTRRQFP